MPSENLQEDIQEKQKDNVFSVPWGNSDVILVVEGKEFHVHRCILSLQSPYFNAMFNGNFKDSSTEKIELKDDKHEAMLPFLQLLYPANMLDEDNGKHKVDINSENVVSIAELADKYEARNVIKQCLTCVKYLQPESTMRLLPYAVRNELPVDDILDVIARRISTDKLENFAPELDNESVQVKTLMRKCRVQENAIVRANTVMLYLLKKYLSGKNTSVECIEHNSLEVQNFKKARKCKNCLMTYKKYFIDNYIQENPGYHNKVGKPFKTSEELIELLELADDIATSLQE